MFAGKHTLTALYIVAFLFITSSASAQTSVNGGSGLFFVDKARTLGNRNFAVGAFYLKSNFNDAGVDTNEAIVSIPATLGLFDSFEISAQFPSANLNPEGFDSVNGMTDGLAKLKWNFHNSEKFNVRIAAIGLISLPLGDEDKGLGTGDTDVGLKLALDKEYKNITWHFNIGYMNHQAEELDPVILYGAGFEWFAMGNLSVISEVSGQSWTDQILWRDDNTKVTSGLRYYVGDWASVSVGYSSWGGGSGEGSPNAMWTAGITVGLGLGQPKPVREAPEAAVEEPVEQPPAAEPPAEPPVEEPAPMVVKIILEGIHFKFDKSDLTDEAKEILNRNAEKLKANPDAKVIVEGHTCSIGSKGYNYKLGIRRAKSAKLYLVRQLGVHPDTMFVITSFGEERPAHTNKTREGRMLNRRVDFVIQSR